MFKLRPKLKIKHRTNGHKPNAMLVVQRKRERTFGYIPRRKIPSDSFEKYYEGKWLHILGVELTGILWPIVPNEPVEGRTPIDLFMAKHCADEVDDVYGLSMPTLEKVKIGILIGLCVAILVVVFLIVQSAGGG